MEHPPVVVCDDDTHTLSCSFPGLSQLLVTTSSANAHTHTNAHATPFMQGSGKTYTMRSMMEQASHAIFEHIQSQPGREFVVSLSVLEIYNEDVFDLLVGGSSGGDGGGGSALRVLDDVHGCTRVEVCCSGGMQLNGYTEDAAG